MNNKYTFVVFSNAQEGREDEYNHWYENIHLDDVLKVHGIIAAQRFRLADTQLLGEAHEERTIRTGAQAVGPWKYMVIYEFETESAAKTFQDLQAKVASGEITVEDVIDPLTMTAYLYTPAGTLHARS